MLVGGDGGCPLNVSRVFGNFFKKKLRELLFRTKEYYFIMFLLLFLDNGHIPFNPGAVAKIFNPIAELVIPMRPPSGKAKAEIEINLVTAEAKTRNCLILFIVV